MKEINQYGKVPPQATELEKAVLGAIMLERDAFDTVSGILKPESFYMQAHNTIFNSMKGLAKKNMPIDLLTVVEELRKKNELESIGGIMFLKNLTDGILGSAHIETHARIISQKFIQRELIRVSSEINSMAYEDSADAFELMDYAEKNIGEIGLNNVEPGMIHIENVMKESLIKIENWRLSGGGITGVPTGFKDIDRATRGLQEGELIYIGARPSVGKTAFVLNLIINAATNKKKPVPVAMFSLEMLAVYLGLRMLSSESKILFQKILEGRLEDYEMKQIIGSANRLAELNIHFDDGSEINLTSLRRKIKRMKKSLGVGLVVIDYLQLMESEEKGGNREQAIAKISRGLKKLTRELQITIIALSQLGRESGSKGVDWKFGPPLGSFRESGAIEQDADGVIMIWAPSEADIAEDEDLFGRVRARTVKWRNGIVLTQEMNFRKEIQLFEAYEEINGSIPKNLIPLKSLAQVKNNYEVYNEEGEPF